MEFGEAMAGRGSRALSCKFPKLWGIVGRIKQYLFPFSEVKALFLKTSFGAPLLPSGHKTCLFS